MHKYFEIKKNTMKLNQKNKQKQRTKINGKFKMCLLLETNTYELL